MLRQIQLWVKFTENEQLRSPVLRVRLFVELQQRALCRWHRQTADAITPRLHAANYDNTNKWSKNSNKRPHRTGRIFHGNTVMWHRPAGEHCSWLLQSRCHAVIEDWIDPCCCVMLSAIKWSHAPQQRFSVLFNGPGNLKIAPSRGACGPHLIHGSLGPLESALPQMASRSIQPFLHRSPACLTHRQTHRHTDHAIYVRHQYQ